MIRRLTLACLVLLVAAVGQVQAVVITNGNLTTDDTGSVITDTALGREYLRFDEFDLTVAQTIAAVAPGGIYEGWTIADSDIADDFIEALFAPTIPPTSVGVDFFGEVAGTLTGWEDGDLGASFDSSTDFTAFTTGEVIPIGLIGFNWAGAGPDEVTQFDPWGTAAQLNGFNSSNRPINLLLYRATAPVPEPTSIALWGIGLIGMAGFAYRRRRRTA